MFFQVFVQYNLKFFLDIWNFHYIVECTFGRILVGACHNEVVIKKIFTFVYLL